MGSVLRGDGACLSSSCNLVNVMADKVILGLDLGTNSIGWAIVREKENAQREVKLGSRIVPMNQDELSDFGKGVTNSAAKSRRIRRAMRRINARRQLRRERMLRVLHLLGFLPEHFDRALGWDRKDSKRYAKLDGEDEQRLPWVKESVGSARFLFTDSFEEMLADFARCQPEWLAGHKVPADWTLYYLRTKALKQAVTREELAWILLSFNQKRGYQMARGEEEEEVPTKQSTYVESRVVRVEEDGAGKKGKKKWYTLHLENGLVYRRESDVSLANMEGQVLQLIVTREYEEDGKTPKLNRYGEEKVSLRAPKEDDWTLRKKRTEHLIGESGLTPGAYIYQHLLECPEEKVRGVFVHTIDRAFYAGELRAILTEQMKHHPELSNPELFDSCVRELYARNEAHRKHLIDKDFVSLFIDDILFYQRPLKSKKTLVDDCDFEAYTFVNKQSGEEIKRPLKCVAKSNPYYQEFRIWQWMGNLRLKDRVTDVDVTSTYLPNEESRVALYEWLSKRKEVKQDDLLKEFLGIKKPRGKNVPYPLSWNYEEERIYPMGETRSELLKALEKAGLQGFEDEALLRGISLATQKSQQKKAEKNPQKAKAIAPALAPEQVEYRLWHLLYSISEREALASALRKFELGEEFVQAFLHVKPFDSGYGSYSEKAVKKLLTVMRCGKYWSVDEVSPYACRRLERIQAGQESPELVERITKQAPLPQSIEECRGLSQSQASYLVYGRHSEPRELMRWGTTDEMLRYIRGIRHNSLRNPIVEKVVLETLRVVHDLWKREGHIDEIHLELGRELKKTAKARLQMTERQLRNEATNMRLRYLLAELASNSDGLLDCGQELRAYSPSQLDLLHIYEEGALATLSEQDEDYDFVTKMSKHPSPSTAELQRYRLWLEQKYRSPYTGKMISLTRLFTRDYEVEHIIPKSLYYDDSLSNKVICETAVNRDKGGRLAYNYIADSKGICSRDPKTALFTLEAYEQFVNTTFAGEALKRKRMNLLRTEIPDGFGQSQLNNTRHIARLIMYALSSIVREEGEKEAISKNLIVCTGGVTDRLKKDWGMHDVWNHLVAPRYERLNELTGTTDFGHWDNKEGKPVFQTTMPLHLQRGYQKKRIDHRHHAMDALVIACATRSMINFVNNRNAKDREEYASLRHALCVEQYRLRKPWDTFTQDAEAALRQLVVSFKQNLRVLTRTTNRYQHYDDAGKKQMVAQSSESLLAIRRSLHKDSFYGRVNLRYKAFVPINKALTLAVEMPERIVDEAFRLYLLERIASGMSLKELKAHFKQSKGQWEGQDCSKVEVWKWSDEDAPLVAIRKPLSPEVKIEKITDTGIQKILRNYLAAKDYKADIAFSPEGIAELNDNISLYNDGQPHKPVKSVRVSDALGKKYQVGQRGNRKSKWVVADEGNNLFFAIYVDENNKRSYDTPNLRGVIERLKQGLPPVDEIDERGRKLLFTLSPYDLVYVPTDEQKEQPIEVADLLPERIFVMRKSSGSRCYFLPQSMAKLLDKNQELGGADLVEQTVFLTPKIDLQERVSIKEKCWKLEVDRLGTITRILR